MGDRTTAPDPTTEPGRAPAPAPVPELAAAIADLTARVALLEEGNRAAIDSEVTPDSTSISAPHAMPDATPSTILQSRETPQPNDPFWALHELQRRLPEHPSTTEGAVVLAGSLTLPDGSPVSWQLGAGTSGILETEWADAAAVFAALGHPVRLELLRQILTGTHTTAALAEIESLGTTGQLHHHLRQLRTSGWVRQNGRGSYEVPAPRIVPLLVCLTGAQR